MHVRRCLKPLLSALLGAAAFGFMATVATSPAAAGIAAGSVFDQFNNPIGGVLVEALDPVTAAPLASTITSAGSGDYSFELDAPASGLYKVRLSDPQGVFATSYLYDRPTFEEADAIGYS